MKKEKLMKKRFGALMLALILACSLTIPAGATALENQTVEYGFISEELERADKIDMMEEEIQQAYLAIEEKYVAQIDTLMQATEVGSVEESSAVNTIKINQFRQQMDAERSTAEKAILEKYGFSPCDSSQNTVLLWESTPTDFSFPAEDVTYDSGSKTYRYTVDWKFLRQDQLWDTYDIAGVGMSNATSYYIVKSFAKTFSNYGAQTCYVDDKANATPAKNIYRGVLSKRSEKNNGVAYSVRDGAIPNVCIPAETGKITIYVAKKTGVSGTPQNKIIFSYEHNYKKYSANKSAVISLVGFDLNGKLAVSYSQKDCNWSTASGGSIIK